MNSVTVIIIDGHNGICDSRNGGYIGLYGPGEYYDTAGNKHREVVHKDYARLFTDLTYFSRVVYCSCRMSYQVQEGATVARGLGEASRNVNEIWMRFL